MFLIKSKQIKNAVLWVGVALCVTPIFVSAQSSDQARTLLELQALRQEIAELRDMVERQGYELRKLKRAQSGAQRPLGDPRQGGLPADGAQPYSIDPAQGPVSGGQNSSQNESFRYAEGSLPAEGSQSAEGSFPAEGSQSAEGSNTGAYVPPVPVAGGPAPVSTGQVIDDSGNGAPVSESVINAPPAQQQGRPEYPPVVDRSIGGSSSPAGESQNQTDYSGTQQADGVNPWVAPSADGDLSNSRTASSNASPPRQVPAYRQEQRGNGSPGNGGVIAVPGQINGSPIGSNVGSNAGGTETNAVDIEANAAGTQANAAGAIPAVLAEQDYYQQGFELLKQSKHDEAVSIFKQQIRAYSQGEYADDAYYWIAESMYVNRKLDKSKQNFKAIIDGYKQSPRLPDAMLKTAYIEQEQGNIIEARILLQEIVQFHPRSNAAISAKNRLAEIKN